MKSENKSQVHCQWSWQDNQFNEVFPSFDLLNPEFRPGNRIINYFSNCFSFYLYNKKSDNLFKDQI